MDASDLERLGVYDPDAPDAADRLVLLEYLVSLGATEEDLLEAHRTQTAGGLALDLTLRGRGRGVTFEALGSTIELDPDEGARLWRALGFPDPQMSGRGLPEEAVEVLQLVATAGREFLGPETTVGLARVMGATTYRLAQALVDAFRANFEAPALRAGMPYGEVIKRYGEVTRDLLPSFLDAVGTIFKEHLIAIASGTWSFDEEGGTARRDLLVGFADMVGYSSLSRGITSGRLVRLLGMFEDAVGETASAHGVRVVKLIGDGAMFVSDEVASGASFALELVDRFDQDPELPSLHVGLAAGPLVSMQGDYFGEAVNVAAHLLQVAPASTVLATVEVAGALGPGITAAPAPEIRLEAAPDAELFTLTGA